MSGIDDEPQHNVFSGHAEGSVVQVQKVGKLEITLPSVKRPRSVPRGLPRAPLRLVNRDWEFGVLDGLLEEAASAPGPVVAVLSGMRGVGKSATGRHWANRVRERFSDGDLSVDLAGRRRDGVVSVSEVLADLIRELESPEFTVPKTLAERVRSFQQITSSRRLLMLLDDATMASEVEPLLPNGAGSVVVVTSNFHLEKLIHDGASLILVDPLDEDAALKLLRKMCGTARIDDEPVAVARLLEVCGGLPVALCVCGARLARARARTVSWLVDDIEDEARRLAGLSGEGGSVRAVFDASYVGLEQREALLYRRLGVHPGREVRATHGAALAGLPLEEAESGFADLEDAHLLEPAHGDFFRQHDLLRIHAGERAAVDDDEPDREKALRRLVELYFAALHRADRVVGFDRLRLATDDPPAVDPALLPSFASSEDVFVWFDLERANLMASLREAAAREWDDLVWPMSEAMWLMVFNRQLYEDWAEAMKLGVESAARSGNAAAEARLRALLSRAYQDRGERERALLELGDALRTAESTGHGQLVASVHEFLGTAYMGKEDHVRAIAEFELSRAFFVENGMRRGGALQDFHLGAALTRNGEAVRALPFLHSAVESLTDIGDELNLGRSMLHLGQAQLGAGRSGEAKKTLLSSLEITVPLGVRHVEAQTHEALAEVFAREGDEAAAVFCRRRAYEAYRDIGHPRAAILEDGLEEE